MFSTQLISAGRPRTWRGAALFPNPASVNIARISSGSGWTRELGTMCRQGTPHQRSTGCCRPRRGQQPGRVIMSCSATASWSRWTRGRFVDKVPDSCPAGHQHLRGGCRAPAGAWVRRWQLEQGHGIQGPTPWDNPFEPGDGVSLTSWYDDRLPSFTAAPRCA